MKRVGYGRVSTAGQARNGTSLAEQKKQLMAAGVAEEDIYLDAYTGTKMHRPQFDACMAALEPDDEFVVCKLDRLAVPPRRAPELSETSWSAASA